MVAAAIFRIMKLAWVTYLGALLRITAILIPRISAHPPILTQCKLPMGPLSRGYGIYMYMHVHEVVRGVVIHNVHFNRELEYIK